jgi:hypothetical protein
MTAPRVTNYTQTISIRSDNPEALVDMLAAWDREQATTDVMGFTGTHLLADREDPGLYLIVAEFAMVDPDVSAAEEAERNNERPETQAWARKLLEVIDGEPVYRQYDGLSAFEWTTNSALRSGCTTRSGAPCWPCVDSPAGGRCGSSTSSAETARSR